MARADNTRYLRLAAQARHDQAVRRAHDAIRTLDRHGQPITFTTIAATAHVSRAWLYRHPELRTVIANHHQTHPGAVPAAQRATTESNTARIDALRLEIEHLRAENTILRDNVAPRTRTAAKPTRTATPATRHRRRPPASTRPHHHALQVTPVQLAASGSNCRVIAVVLCPSTTLEPTRWDWHGSPVLVQSMRIRAHSTIGPDVGTIRSRGRSPGQPRPPTTSQRTACPLIWRIR